jgi:hypothetical protein
VRRFLAQTERKLSEAVAAREVVTSELAASTDHDALARLSRSLADAEVDVAEIEERWLALADELGS